MRSSWSLESGATGRPSWRLGDPSWQLGASRLPMSTTPRRDRTARSKMRYREVVLTFADGHTETVKRFRDTPQGRVEAESFASSRVGTPHVRTVTVVVGALGDGNRVAEERRRRRSKRIGEWKAATR